MVQRPSSHLIPLLIASLGAQNSFIALSGEKNLPKIWRILNWLILLERLGKKGLIIELFIHADIKYLCFLR